MAKRKFLVVTNNFSEKVEAASVLIKPEGHVVFFDLPNQAGKIVAYYSANSFVSFKGIEES